MIRIFFTLKGQYIKTEAAYPVNFWMMLISGVLTRFLSMIIPFVIYKNIPAIAGWKVQEIYLMISYLFLAEGLCSIFFEGVWKIPGMVFDGSFDTILSRPVPPLFQVLTYGIGLQGIGVAAFALVSLTASLISLGYFSVYGILFSIFFVAAGTMICLSIYTISCSTVFWFNSNGSSTLPFAISNLSQYARYPVSMYPKIVRIILLFVIPYAFIGEIPVRILRGEHIIMLSLAMAGISLLFLTIARQFFYKGIAAYESVGM